MNIAILFGGRSAEHEVSCMSAYTVYKALETKGHELFLIGITKEGQFLRYLGDLEELRRGNWKQGAYPQVDILPSGETPGLYIGKDKIKIEAVFPALHGAYGEDGKIQGLLECCDIPYAGADLMTSAICMDKDRTKGLLSLYGIEQVPWRSFYTGEEEKVIEVESMGYPLFVKPANTGSSIGISKVRNERELREAVKLAFVYDEKILVEKGLEAREIEVAALGNRGKAVFSRPGEILFQEEFYDYETKYFKEETRLQIPASVDAKTEKEILSVAQRVYEAVEGEGLARIDFFVEKTTGKVYLNEINTMPGFTHASMYPRLMEEAGWPIAELAEELIRLAVERRERQRYLKKK